MADELSWGEVPITGENVTETEIKDAESMGKAPVGKFLCTCVKSAPREKHPKDPDKPSYFVANLHWRIDKCLQINGQAVVGDEGEAYEGRKLFDEVILPREGEKDGLRKRRILIASRTGVISATSEAIPANAWSELIQDKRAVLEHIEETYTDANDNKKTIRKVAFSGYESADKAAVVTADSFSDI